MNIIRMITCYMFSNIFQVKFPQGTEMLNIFKSYCSKTSILEDFDFYENRQKAMQDKKIKVPASKMEHLLVNWHMHSSTIHFVSRKSYDGNMVFFFCGYYRFSR